MKKNNHSTLNKITDIFGLLKKDHQEVKANLEQIMSGKVRNEEVFKLVEKELAVHILAEEKHLYPELENDERTREIVLEAYEEHDLAKKLLKKLSTNSMDDEHWLAKIKVLLDVIDHHVKEEERDMFPKAKQVLDRESRDRIKESIMKEKESAFGTSGPAIEESEESMATSTSGKSR